VLLSLVLEAVVQHSFASNELGQLVESSQHRNFVSLNLWRSANYAEPQRRVDCEREMFERQSAVPDISGARQFGYPRISRTGPG
jgi:hypothetical protein